MCGIYGMIGKPTNPKQAARFMTALALHTVPRGQHSMGFFAITEEESILEKCAVHPKEFLRISSFVSVIQKDKAYILMGHNRWASIGEINNENAHPFEGGMYVLAHNGTCPTALEKVKALGIRNHMNGTTDSEAILMLIEHHGIEKLSTILSSLYGFSLSIADKATETLYFARDVNPLFVADLRPILGVRAWSSTVEIMAAALRTTGIDPGKVTGFNTKPYSIYKVSLASGLEFEKAGTFVHVPKYDDNPRWKFGRGGPAWLTGEMDEDEPEVDEEEMWYRHRNDS